MSIKQKKLVGIEIGTRNIKMVKLNSRGKVKKYTYVNLPEGTISAGEIKSQEMLVATLKQARKQLRSSSKKCALCISSPDIVIRYLFLPIMEEKYIMQNIRMELSGFLPENPENYTIDYIITERIEEEEKKQIKILIFAAPTRVLRAYNNAMKSAGFKVKYIDVMENSYEKLFKMLRSKGITKEKNFACVYIDYSRVSVSVYGGGRFFINKIIDNAMGMFCEDISDKTGTPIEIVRKQIFTEDILTSTEAFKVEKEVIENYIEELTTRINRVIKYYNSRNEDEPLEALYFTGGFTHIIGIQEYIGNLLGIPIINTARYLDLMFKKPPHKNNGIDYTNAIAITLREED